MATEADTTTMDKQPPSTNAVSCATTASAARNHPINSSSVVCNAATKGGGASAGSDHHDHLDCGRTRAASMSSAGSGSNRHGRAFSDPASLSPSLPARDPVGSSGQFSSPLHSQLLSSSSAAASASLSAKSALNLTSPSASSKLARKPPGSLSSSSSSSLVTPFLCSPTTASSTPMTSSLSPMSSPVTSRMTAAAAPEVCMYVISYVGSSHDCWCDSFVHGNIYFSLCRKVDISTNNCTYLKGLGRLFGVENWIG